jgi:hypothetical protein
MGLNKFPSKFLKNGEFRLRFCRIAFILFWVSKRVKWASGRVEKKKVFQQLVD